ncbi:hypothetical protein H5410_062053, partial [Solanum commersonii]
MKTLKPYMDEVKDTIIDALKANLKGVTVLTYAVENERMKYWVRTIPTNLVRILFRVDRKIKMIIYEKLRRAQKNKKNKATDLVAVNEDYTTPTIDKDGAAVDVDEILPLAIVDEDLVAVDEYFGEE